MAVVPNRWVRPLAACGAAALAILLTGCAAGPDYVRPAPAAVPPPGFAAADSLARPAAGLPVAAWWRSFGDPVLDGLVDEALARNHDLAAATARVLESRALLGGSEAARWPTVDLSGSVTRSKQNLNQFGGGFGPPGGGGAFYNTLYNTSATMRYELDLWGRLSRGEEAARAALLAGEADRRTVLQTLVADVVRTWLEVRELECQLDLTRRTVASYGHSLEIVEQRYRRGIADPVDVYLARQNLLAARAQEPQWIQDLAAARRRLEILAGRYPAGEAARRGEGGCALPSELPPVPPGLPSDLLERRSDVIAAEMRLRGAVARIGEAKADLFPRLSLTGTAGYSSRELSDLVRDSSSIWNLVGNLTMPLLNRGARTSQLRAAEARAEAAAAAYQSALLRAFQEVENALQAEEAQRARRALLDAAAAEARRSVALAEERYQRGLDSLLLTLDSQRRLYGTESELLRTERQLRTVRVNLILALGGPWDASLTRGPDGRGPEPAVRTAAAAGSTPAGETP